MRKTPTQRLAMASDMWDAAKEMMIAGIHARRGPLSPVELRVELFLQLYGHEFSDERRAQIVAGLRLRK